MSPTPPSFSNSSIVVDGCLHVRPTDRHLDKALHAAQQTAAQFHRHRQFAGFESRLCRRRQSPPSRQSRRIGNSFSVIVYSMPMSN